MMMPGRYVFNENTPIIIYGAATEGHLLLHRLKDHTNNILGFIDKRADELSDVEGYPVYNIGSEKIRQLMKKKPVIVVAVKNVFDHRAIGYLLNHRLDAKKIVLIPVELEDKQEGKLEKVYNDLFYDVIQFPYELNEIHVDHLYPFRREDYRFIRGGSVVIPVPVSKVFTNKGETEWSDINIAAYFPHIRIFQFFSGEVGGSEKSYVNFCIEAANRLNVETTNQWKNNVIENRRRVYNEMRMNYELDHSFFIDHAVSGEWDKERHYFNLTGGKHRAAFLVSMGCCFIPLEVSFEDEEAWLNEENAKKIYDDIESDIEKPIETIDNPFFYKRTGEKRALDNSLFVSTVTALAELLYCKYGKIDFSKVNLIIENKISDYLVRELLILGCRNGNEIKLKSQIICLIGGRESYDSDVAICEKYDEKSHRFIRSFICRGIRASCKYHLVARRFGDEA